MEINKIIKINYEWPNVDIEVNWDYIDSFTEFQTLKEIKQSPEWHAEGTAYQHTKLVVDWAIQSVKHFGLNREDAKIVVLSALFHDIGKITTTFTGEDGRIHSYGHEKESDKITRKLLWNEDPDLRERICNNVKLHMQLHELKRFKHYHRFETKLLNLRETSYDFSLLAILGYCDVNGSQYEPKAKEKDVKFAEEVYNYAFGRHSKRRCRDLFFSYYDYRAINVMIGLPGAGKSTAIQNLTKDFLPGSNYTILSRDLIRVELGFCNESEKIVGTKEQEDRVTELFNQKFKEALDNKVNIFIDNINLKRCYREQYKSITNKYPIYWNYIYVQSKSLEDNYERRPMISKEVFDEMLDRFEFPTPDEYDNLLIYDEHENC